MSDKKKGRALLWIILGIVAFSVVGFMVLVGVAVSIVSRQEKVAERGVLEIELKGALTEGPSRNPFEDLAGRFGGDKKQHLWNIRRALARAADDDRIHALRIDITGRVGGMAVAEEILDLVAEFRDSGKPVYTYLSGDLAGNQPYLLATAGDRIWLPPQAGLMVDGLRFEVSFWRGTLDKLHIDPHFIMYKEYKSAGEPFTRYEMSAYFREHLTAVGEDMESRLVSVIAQRRNLDPKDVEATIDRGLMTATEALEAGWVDRLGYPDELESAIADAVRLDEYEGIPVGKYLKAMGKTKIEGDRIAVIFGEGQIVAADSGSPFKESRIYGPETAKVFDDAVEDDHVKAIVFRVNSPGGSAIGSDYVWRAVKRAEEAGKPVIVSMSSVAGSGGYWISMGADKIVAQPTTITGSIGVVMGKFNVRGFYEWIGANVSDVTFARNADLMSAFEPLKPEHEERFRAWMDEVYTQFKEKVAQGRGLQVNDVETIAKGRIWSGLDAKEIGLVDEIGGLSVALRLAREAAGLPDATPAQAYPGPKDFFQMLAEGDFDVRMSQQLSLLDISLAPAVRSLPGSAQFLQLLQELETPRPWAIMPSIEVR